MYAIEMSSAPKLSYQKLRNGGGLDDDYEESGRALIGRARSWFRFRKVAIRKRFKLRIQSLRRFLRRKARLVSAVRVSWAEVMKRLKESIHILVTFSLEIICSCRSILPDSSVLRNLFKGHHDFSWLVFKALSS